jgi:hypothetical protein
MRYAISSHQATIYGVTCLAYVMLRKRFERLAESVPLVGKGDRRFNRLLLRLARTATNRKLIGPNLFDAVELHLTDPRMFYNPVEWKINEKMVGLVRGPVASFHAHVERNPLLRKYVFNLCETSRIVRCAIRSQLEMAYRVMNAHSDSVVTENPVFVFHAGIARDDGDRERAFPRLRENLEYIAIANQQFYEKYGRERKLIPTIENSPRDRLSLCQTIDECKKVTERFASEIKLTVDYGHILTVDGERERLMRELDSGSLGQNIVNIHLHYSPEIDDEVRHAHSPLSMIPESRLSLIEDDLRKLVEHTRVREQGYVTLEIPSKDPLDYMPWLGSLRRAYAIVSRSVKATGVFDCAAYRGTIEDQLASLRIVRGMMEYEPNEAWEHPCPVADVATSTKKG